MFLFGRALGTQVRSLDPQPALGHACRRYRFHLRSARFQTQAKDGSSHLYAGAGISGLLTKLRRAKIAQYGVDGPPALPAGQWRGLQQDSFPHHPIPQTSQWRHRSAGKARLANGGRQGSGPQCLA